MALVMAKYDKYFNEILTIDKNCIAGLFESLDMKVMDEIVDLLLTVKTNSKKVITAGCGTSGIAAEKIAHMLNAIEVPSFFLAPGNSVHGGMGAIQRGDVVVLLTKGGNTKEILNYIPVCKAKGAKIIGVTQNDDSALANNADIYFKIKVDNEADIWNMCASVSCTAIIAVFDAVAFTIMEHNGYTKEDLLLTHPGGKVGEILKENFGVK